MYKKILVAYDGSAGAQLALTHALSLAKALGAALTALWVHSSLPHYPETPSEINEEKEAADAYFEHIVNDVQTAATATGLAVQVEARAGGVAQVILQFAEEGAYDLIVLGSRGHSGTWGHLLGHTTDRVSDHAQCSVLIVKGETAEEGQDTPERRPDALAQPVRNIMRTEVLSVQPETPIEQVLTRLLQRGYRSLPVVAGDGRLVGIITDGDLLRRANLKARLDLQAELSAADLQRQLAELQAQAKQAADVMTQPVVTVQAGEPVRQAVTLMARHGLKRLPVTDNAGRLVGLVSRVDVLRAVGYHQTTPDTGPEAPHSGATVADLMYSDVPTVGPQARLEEIVRALEASQRRRAVVVDKERHVLGIITDGDLLRRSRQAPPPGLLERLRTLVTGQKEAAGLLPDAGERAAQLMTTPVITIRTDTPLSEALRLMLDHQIKRLPVVDAEGRLVGILGRASLLHGLLSSASAA